ncbi:MAG TPA: hypothetical protein VEI97_12495 [bacterium]|nr:hypothetical protein [bacterium]
MTDRAPVPFRRTFEMEYDPGRLVAACEVAADALGGAVTTTLQVEWGLEEGSPPAYHHSESHTYPSIRDARTQVLDLVRAAMSSGVYGWGSHQGDIEADLLAFCRNVLEEFEVGPFDPPSGGV